MCRLVAATVKSHPAFDLTLSEQFGSKMHSVDGIDGPECVVDSVERRTALFKKRSSKYDAGDYGGNDGKTECSSLHEDSP
jgi:hypothetical protein